VKQQKIDTMPAKLDFLQSATGLILGFFIIGHILFEASILISEEMMYKVSIFFEGYYFFGEKYPGIISFLAAAVFFIFILHAGIAMRKFPSSYKKYKIMKEHVNHLDHEDTNLWIIQITTGFLMFFIGSVHLYIMMTQPQNIGPYASSYRIVEELMGPLYFVLLISVVFHAFIGIYRLALKWGFMQNHNRKRLRRRLKIGMRILIATYITIGLFALWKYVDIGMTKDVTQRYVPTTPSLQEAMKQHKGDN